MKKTYEKPRLIFHEFAMNDSIAACWRIVCEGHLGGGPFGTHEPHDDNILIDKQQYDPSGDISTESKGKNTIHSYTLNDVKHFDVRSEEYGSSYPAHPNASA